MTQDSDERESTVSADTKAKFKEALERKNASQHRSTEGSANTGTVHGSETAGPVQRTFRRKSG